MITAASILACRFHHARAACGLKTIESCNTPSETSAAKRIDERNEQSARLSLDIDGAIVAIDEPVAHTIERRAARSASPDRVREA
jgi:hypothetical protein